MAETGYKIPILKQDNDRIQIWLQGWDEKICNSIVGDTLLALDHPFIFSFWNDDSVIAFYFTFDSNHIIDNAETLYNKLDPQYIGERYKYVGPNNTTIDRVNRNRGNLTTNTIYEVVQRPGDKKCIFICYNDEWEYTGGSEHRSSSTQIGFPCITTMNRENYSGLTWNNVVYTYYKPFIYILEKHNLFNSLTSIRFQYSIGSNWPEIDTGDIYLKNQIYSGDHRDYISTINHDIYYYNQDLELTEILPKPTEWNPLGNLNDPYYKNTYFQWNMNPESIVLDQYDYFNEIFETRGIFITSIKPDNYLITNKNGTKQEKYEDSNFYVVQRTTDIDKLFNLREKYLMDSYKNIKLLEDVNNNTNTNIFKKYNPTMFLPVYRGNASLSVNLWDNNTTCFFFKNDTDNDKYSYALYYDSNRKKIIIKSAKWNSISEVPSWPSSYSAYKEISNEKTKIILELQGGGGAGERAGSGNYARQHCPWSGGGGGYIRCILYLNNITDNDPIIITLSPVTLDQQNPTKKNIYFNDLENNYDANNIYSYLSIYSNYHLITEHGFTSWSALNGGSSSAFYPFGGKCYLEHSNSFYYNFDSIQEQIDDQRILLLQKQDGGNGAYDTIYDHYQSSDINVSIDTFLKSNRYIDLYNTTLPRGVGGSTNFTPWETDRVKKTRGSTEWWVYTNHHAGCGGGGSPLGYGLIWNSSISTAGYGGGGCGGECIYRNDGSILPQWSAGSYGQPACFIIHT